jgi:hypothetical protein
MATQNPGRLTTPRARWQPPAPSIPAAAPGVTACHLPIDDGFGCVEWYCYPRAAPTQQPASPTRS